MGTCPRTSISLWACRRRFSREERHERTWPTVLAVGAIACLVSLVADLLKLYPITPRTTLYLLPWLLLMLTAGFEMIPLVASAAMGRLRVLTWWNIALICATCAIATVFVRAHWFVPFEPWDEDNQAAVLYLKRAAEPGDALWVHATASEGFKLYSRIEHWTPDGLIAHGDTGWPCCRRYPSSPVAASAGEATSPRVTITNDMEAKLPAHLPARLWFLYSSRAIEIQKAPDEVRFARLYLKDRGCGELPGASFVGVGVLLFQCGETDRAQ
jgi:hypothetical protein